MAPPASSSQRTPESAASTPLGADGMPRGWIDAHISNVELYYAEPRPAPCPPCPPDLECAPCRPPFHEFSKEAPGHSRRAPLWVHFTEEPEGLVVGSLYRLTVRRVAWQPHGEVLITIGGDAKKIGTPSQCDALRKAFLDRRALATNRCSKDDDCANAPGGIDDCGQVIDRETAARLFELYTQIQRDCGLNRHCAPRLSIPKCEQGRCVRSTDPPGKLGGRGLNDVVTD